MTAKDPFRAFRAALDRDPLASDEILQGWLASAPLDAPSKRLVVWASRFSRTLADSADVVERVENRPRLAGKRRPTALDVWLPPDTQRNLASVHGSGLWDPRVNDHARYAAIFLLAQNGEAGVMCSLACTDGLVRALRGLGTDKRERALLTALEGSTPRRFLHGAQFVTEIQGGSDAGANRVRAEPQGDGSWRISGQKWFCSNLTADLWLVTARPVGAPEGVKGLGLFLVPKSIGGKANGHVVERLKDKLGTRALATAEIMFDGATAWPLGPLEAGLKNMLGIVLTTSRIHNTLASAAMLRAAARHARAYASTRIAFGRPILEQPLVADVVRRVEEAADRTAAGAFALVDLWSTSDAAAKGAAGAWPRAVVSLAKAITARRAERLTYEAMMLFGGNGIEERFSAMPRLWRDAAIFETWEGPYTLLLTQALGDLVRFGVPGHEREFLLSATGAADRADVEELREILADHQSPANVLRWVDVAHRLHARFEDRAVTRLIASSKH